MHIPSLTTKRTKNNKVLEHSVLCYFTVFSNIFENILPYIICYLLFAIYYLPDIHIMVSPRAYEGILDCCHTYIHTHT